MDRRDFWSQKWTGFGPLCGQFAFCQPPCGLGGLLSDRNKGQQWPGLEAEVLGCSLYCAFQVPPTGSCGDTSSAPVCPPGLWRQAGTEEPVLAIQKLWVYRGDL